MGRGVLPSFASFISNCPVVYTYTFLEKLARNNNIGKIYPGNGISVSAIFAEHCVMVTVVLTLVSFVLTGS